MKYQRPKGTQDYFEIKSYKLEKIRSTFFQVMNKYDFQYLETPIFEQVDLFKRTTGDLSDIVKKELYEFSDKGNRQLALRPEGTASALRAIVENKINLPARVFYFGQMFRYENPQKGRQRQFFQGGIEWLSNNNGQYDCEIILIANDFLNKLNIKDYHIEINWLGSFEERQNYNLVLKKYFEKYKDELESFSLQRLEKNALRILDDKIEMKKYFVKNAPKLINYLLPESKQKLNDVLAILEKNLNKQITIKINYNLVRGFDYYQDLVFEFISNSEKLGTQSTILGGGSYNTLLENIGGPNLPGIGFAFGVERIMEILDLHHDETDNKIIAYGINSNQIWNLLLLRSKIKFSNYQLAIYEKEIAHNKAFKNSQIKKANLILFFSDNEQQLIIKNNLTKKQSKFTLEQLYNFDFLNLDI